MGPLIGLGLWTLVAGAEALGQPTPSAAQVRSWRDEGQVIWVDAPDGRLKVRAYTSGVMTDHPVLVLWIHGDLGPGAEPYELAQRMARVTENVVVAALLRPGYTDAEGDVSAGRKGYAIGDNYTARVVDDVHAAINQLKARFHAHAFIVTGHSGGAGITGNLLGRHPEDANAAVLIACSCDPKGFMSRWVAEHPETPKGLPNPSLSPLELVDGVVADPCAHGDGLERHSGLVAADARLRAGAEGAGRRHPARHCARGRTHRCPLDLRGEAGGL
jgi:pimeloyl-ACP methyl ester carboxylesterase